VRERLARQSRRGQPCEVQVQPSDEQSWFQAGLVVPVLGNLVELRRTGHPFLSCFWKRTRTRQK
jgi:hypothetical protein